MSAIFRVYGEEELGADGYPAEWHETLKHAVREQAGHRCVRCGHPYRSGEHGTGEWTPCDRLCAHSGPYRVLLAGEWYPGEFGAEGLRAPRLHVIAGNPVEAAWRILTVHHLDGNKANCRWWNLCALCQRCHLEIQGRVRMERRWPHEHSDWFKPYVAGYYAHAFLGEDLDRDEVNRRLDELLALEDRQLAIEASP
jgi:hypothetical protein